jgi:hypothetical protein
LEGVEKAKKEYGLLEKALSYVPGYHGYKEKEIRRETDRMVRSQVSSKLKSALDNTRDYLTYVPRMNDMDRELAEKAISRFDLAIQSIEKAPSGYSGFFDIVKVRETRLNKMIDYDVQLLSKSDEVVNIGDKIDPSNATVEEARSYLEQLLSAVDSIVSLIRQRESYFKSL